MAIWVIKDGQREGPYEEQDVRELIYEGTYSDAEPAIRDGQFDWSTLGQLLGREGAAAGADEEDEEEPAALEPAPEAVAEPPPIPAERVELTPSAQEPPLRVTVADFQMPFGSMVLFMVKWVLAAIPALLILAVLVGIVCFGLLALMAVLFRR